MQTLALGVKWRKAWSSTHAHVTGVRWKLVSKWFRLNDQKCLWSIDKMQFRTLVFELREVGDDVSSWQRQVKRFLLRLCLAPTLFSLYTNGLPVTGSRRFIYADDFYWVLQAETFSKIECPSCQILSATGNWNPACPRLKSVFHLHNNRSCCELNVCMNGQRWVSVRWHRSVYLSC